MVMRRDKCRKRGQWLGSLMRTNSDGGGAGVEGLGSVIVLDTLWICYGGAAEG